jgi:hypothetical protein
MLIRTWLFTLLFLSFSLSAFADSLASSPTTSPANSASSRDQNSECQPLSANQSRVVNDTSQQSPTAIPRHYRVTGTKDPKVVNLDLNIHLNPPSPNALKDAQKCFRDFEDKLKAPGANSPRLHVNLVDDPAVPSVNVAFGDGSPLSAYHWTTNMTCPQYIHESLHFTGLVDTYDNEVDAQGKPRFDCRATEKTTKSVMFNGDQAFADKTETMMCDCQSDSCMDDEPTTKDVGPGGGCPAGYRGSRSFRPMPPEALAQYKKQFKSNSIPGQVLITRPPAEPTAALTKALTMTITQPFCNRGSTYFQCAKYSLQSSTQPGGCPDMPSMCKDGSWMQ